MTEEKSCSVDDGDGWGRDGDEWSGSGGEGAVDRRSIGHTRTWFSISLVGWLDLVSWVFLVRFQTGFRTTLDFRATLIKV